MFRIVAALLVACAVGAPIASAQDASEALGARLQLTKAAQTVENARRDLEIAQLRHSSARTGQAHKHDNFFASIANPGSRKRWQEAVATATAEVEAARAALAFAQDGERQIREKTCSPGLQIPECLSQGS